MQAIGGDQGKKEWIIIKISNLHVIHQLHLDFFPVSRVVSVSLAVFHFWISVFLEQIYWKKKSCSRLWTRKWIVPVLIATKLFLWEIQILEAFHRTSQFLNVSKWNHCPSCFLSFISHPFFHFFFVIFILLQNTIMICHKWN